MLKKAHNKQTSTGYHDTTMKQRFKHLPTGLAAMSCSPTARTASASAAAWLALLTIRCCDTTDRSSSAVCRATACDPSTFLPPNTDTQRHKHTRATAIESEGEGRGEAAAYRRLSLRTKSLTSGCTSGMAESAVGTPGDGRGPEGFGIWVGSAARGG